MAEHLFKLKKDGKTVGYLKILDGFLQGSLNGSDWHYIIEQNPAGDLHLLNNQWIELYDSAHSFVTKDKNGEDVFAGDKVKSWYTCGRLIADDLIVQCFHPTASNGYNSANMNDIELIEEEK